MFGGARLDLFGNTRAFSNAAIPALCCAAA
jgi:hypothetical protein